MTDEREREREREVKDPQEREQEPEIHSFTRWKASLHFTERLKITAVPALPSFWPLAVFSRDHNGNMCRPLNN